MRALLILAGCAASLSALAEGCYHLIEPTLPPPIPVDGDLSVFPKGLVLRLENGYEAPEVVWIRSDGIHQMEVDLRDWSGRLVSELAAELRRRRVGVSVSAASLSGTSAVTSDVPRTESSPETKGSRVLRVWVCEVRAPPLEEDGGVLISAELGSDAADFRGSYATGPDLRGFRDALYQLKKTILEDSKFREWVIGQRAE